jgi:hypothetical protein
MDRTQTEITHFTLPASPVKVKHLDLALHCTRKDAEHLGESSVTTIFNLLA